MNTTIKISKDTKKLISVFGSKEDTYEDIIIRMYASAVKEQLRSFIYNKDSVPIDDAIKRAKIQWF